MKSKIAVILLAVFLCLTTGCNNASHIAEQPAPVLSSGSNEAPHQGKRSQARFGFSKILLDDPMVSASVTFAAPPL